MPNTEVCVYFMKDGVMTCSEKLWHTSLNGPLLIIPKRQVLELNGSSARRRSFWRHMMLFCSRCESIVWMNLSPSRKKKWNVPSISRIAVFLEDFSKYRVMLKSERTTK